MKDNFDGFPKKEKERINLAIQEARKELIEELEKMINNFEMTQELIDLDIGRIGMLQFDDLLSNKLKQQLQELKQGEMK